LIMNEFNFFNNIITFIVIKDTFSKLDLGVS